jgi:hypothetical protein
MSLKLMKQKGIISQAEYDSAVKELQASTGQRAPEEGTVVVGKVAITIYGFIQDDNIYDTTRSLIDQEGNTQIARAETQAGKNPRWTMGIRNTRLGFRLKAPEIDGGIRTSGTIETDFLGTQLPVGNSGQPYQGTEAAFITNPTLRARHAYFRIETPIVDILAGQYWQLFGWQPVYQPNTVEIQGIPGQIYGRTPQIRVSKTLHFNPLTLEGAVAMTRPFQRDAGTPDGQAGIRVALDSWQTIQTNGQTGTQIGSLSVAATGLLRHVAVDNFSANPTYTNDLGMAAWAVDGFIPIIPVTTKDDRSNALSIQGEYAKGSGFADQYTSFTGGATFPTLPVPVGSPPGTTATPFSADIDNGVVTYDSNGHLHSIDWNVYLVGAQYYTPLLNGHIWVSGNYSHAFSDNIHLWGSPTKLTSVYDFFDVCLFWDMSDFVRVGGEYANFNTQYVDGAHAINHRFQLSGFLIF